MARILITGGAGYIGSVLCEILLDQGHHVDVLDNFRYGQASLNHLCWIPTLTIHNGDARLPQDVGPLLHRADIIIPLAALLVGAPICKKDPLAATTTNKDAIHMILRNISPEQLILMPTTNSAYGTGDYCDETSPLNPLSLYAQDKVEVEKRLMAHRRAVSFRLATVFGMSPRMRIDLLVNDFVYRAVNDGFIVLFEGNFKRNYIHVFDVCQAFLMAIDNPSKMVGEIFNVGMSDANLSKLQLCEAIQNHITNFTFAEAPLRKDPDQRNYIVSNKKIENLGFMPAVSLDLGIQELIKGYQMLKNTRYGNV